MCLKNNKLWASLDDRGGSASIDFSFTASQLLAGWPWGSHLTSEHFNFLIECDHHGFFLTEGVMITCFSCGGRSKHSIMTMVSVYFFFSEKIKSGESYSLSLFLNLNSIFFLNKVFIYLFSYLDTWHVELAQPGIELMHPTLEVQSLNHWTTREIQENHTFLINDKQGNNCPQEVMYAERTKEF